MFTVWNSVRNSNFHFSDSPAVRQQEIRLREMFKHFKADQVTVDVKWSRTPASARVISRTSILLKTPFCLEAA